MKPEQERLSTVLKDTISLLCKNSLSFDKQIMVQGIIAITVDKEDVVVVQVNDYMGLPNYEPCVACGKRDPRPAELDTPSRKRACSPSSQDSRRHSKTPRSDHSSAQSPYHDADSDPDEDTSRVSVKKEVDTDDEDLILIDSEIKGENVDYSDSLNNFNMSYGGGGGGGGEEAPFITGYLDNSQISGITASSTPGGSQLQQPGNLAWAQQQQGGSMSQGDGGGGQTQTQSSRASVHPYRCSMCHLAFNTMESLRLHIDEFHVNYEGRPFGCPIEGCLKFFKRQEHLRRHLLVHSNEKPHVCSFCEYKSTSSSNLYRHVKTVHTATLPPRQDDMIEEKPVIDDAPPLSIQNAPAEGDQSDRGKLACSLGFMGQNEGSRYPVDNTQNESQHIPNLLRDRVRPASLGLSESHETKHTSDKIGESTNRDTPNTYGGEI